MVVATDPRVEIESTLRKAGRQIDVAARIGIEQGTLSKVVTGQPFGRKVGVAIVRAFPELREAVAAAMLDAA